MRSLLKSLLVVLLITACQSQEENSQGKDFLSKVNQVNENIEDNSALLTFFRRTRNPIEAALNNVPVGDNKPKGWILAMMRSDLNHGMVGALDDLYPGFAADDIFNTDRRGSLSDVPEMGDLVLTGEEWEQSIMWWNAETIGNWYDGFVRHAFATGDEAAIAQSKAIVENLLESQDESGYIGIYKENLRYQHEVSNGELWAQTTAFRTMLGYYEHTKDQRVLEAVEKGMALTMEKYGVEGKNPFLLKNEFGGVTHGLMITDVCETLHRITGNQAYQDYVVYLYEAFSTYSLNRAFNDLRYPFLKQRDSLFVGHGVHTYEHFRSLIEAYYATGYPELKEAYENALYKLDKAVLPSGAGHAMEWLAGLEADADHTASEFCTMLELRNSYGSMVQKTGNIDFADRAEKLTFNGMMGVRNPEGTALTYGKHDNEYILDGHAHHGKGEPEVEVRYKYSPMHDDPAVCCVPNYTRNYSYYVDMMWMRKGAGLAAVLYGPSTLKTEVEGVTFQIEQETDYPFSDEIKFHIAASDAKEIPLYFRKPGWASEMDVEALGAEISLEEGFYVVSAAWGQKTTVHITFEHETEQKPFNEEVYYQRGPLVFSYEIPSKREVFREHAVEGFNDYYVLPQDESYKDWKLNSAFSLVENSSLSTNPWANPRFLLTGKVINKKDGSEEEIQLRPMGGTALRKVTFDEMDDSQDE